MNFSHHITTWYQNNKRDLPWRKTNNPYHIWLSEIILQQTRVNQGLPYYESFTKNFPTIKDLATADEEKVLKLWQGLGYYSRARNLHATAKTICESYEGNFPKTFNELKKLKGIGDYTGAAIASFTFNEVVPVVDGNVYRVLSRYLGITTDISHSSARKIFFETANQLIDKNNPALFNQAIMEFGALQCTPKSPDCTKCPLNNSCFALANNEIENLPIKSKKTKVKKRFLNYLLILDSENRATTSKRTSKGIWQNLYELPHIETKEKDSETSLIQKIKEYHPNNTAITHIKSESITHKLSHQHLEIEFWKITIDHKHNKGLTHQELLNLPTPIVLHNFIERNPY